MELIEGSKEKLESSLNPRLVTQDLRLIEMKDPELE